MSKTSISQSIRSSKSRSNLKRSKNRHNNKSSTTLPFKRDAHKEDNFNISEEKSLSKLKRDNKYSKNFHINYSSAVKKMGKTQARDKDKLKKTTKKKIILSKMMSNTKNPHFMKKMKQLYSKEIENKKTKNLTSMADLDQSPNRQKVPKKRAFDRSRKDSESVFSDLSDISKQKLGASRKSGQVFESPFRVKKKTKKDVKAKKSAQFSNFDDSSDNDFSYGLGYDEKNKSKGGFNDEFIDIQGIDKSRKNSTKAISHHSKS